ncbi:MAG TPA: hypothetical protein VFJ91_00910 [Gaiellaceae bacterium]|nr:hypothetical protein [Gaiellaceae bacterium]
MSRLLLGALLVALAFPLAASGGSHAASPRAGTVLGGGYQPADLNAAGLTMLALDVVDAKHVAVWVTPFVSRCVGDTYVFRAPLAADGSFHGVYKHGYDAKDDAYLDGGGTIEYSGRFLSASKAAGTVRLVWAEGATSCDSDTISWTANAKSSALSGAAAASALYAGTTSQRSTRAPVRMPLMVRVSADGKTAAATAYINVFCKDPRLNITSGGFYAGPGMKIGSDGSMHEFGSFSSTVGDRKIAYTSTFSGRFGAKAVTGTWTLKAVVTAKKTGKKLDSCSSGTLTWSAGR